MSDKHDVSGLMEVYSRDIFIATRIQNSTGCFVSGENEVTMLHLWDDGWRFVKSYVTCTTTIRCPQELGKH